MALLDEAKKVSAKRGPRCTVGVFMENLTPDEHAELVEAIDTPNVPLTAIVAALKARGHEPPHYRSWQRHHLRMECDCHG